MNPIWKHRLILLGAAAGAAWLGTRIAEGAFAWPALAAGALALFAVTRLRVCPPGALVLGLAVAGYIVGNRGFAQFSLAGGALPLLPAEAALLAAGALTLLAGAGRGELPVRRDALNLAVLAWMAVCSARLYFDMRSHGFFTALRDYATVYYAAFFFLAQEAGRAEPGRKFLRGCLLASCAALLAMWPLTLAFPNFFLNTLTVRGVPVIYFKGDLAGTFMAAGAALFFLRWEGRGRWWNLAASLALAAGALATENRASMLGLAVATGWLLAAGRWRFVVALAAAGAAGAAANLLGAAATGTPLDQTKTYAAYERVVSLGDLGGEQAYQSEEAANKGANNQFRKAWWRAVLDETVEGGPWLGLGFGHDLAERFVRQYYPDDPDDFTTRSPHNVLLTVFARTGAVGLGGFLAVLAAMAAQTWRAAREKGEGRGEKGEKSKGAEAAGPWCAAWVILTSACFGVVLEGPMGAVVFWTLLGLGNAELAAAENE